jgi:Kef-type K+ transport system membrane component KefB
MSKIILIIFIIASFLIYIFLWNPYIRKVKNNIWRTKGMLNMVPLILLQNNESFRN